MLTVFLEDSYNNESNIDYCIQTAVDEDGMAYVNGYCKQLKTLTGGDTAQSQAEKSTQQQSTTTTTMETTTTTTLLEMEGEMDPESDVEMDIEAEEEEPQTEM